MTLLPVGVKAHLAYGYTDKRKGMDGLPASLGELWQDPFTSHLFVFLWSSNIKPGRDGASPSLSL